MRGQLPRLLALPLTAAVLLLPAAPALAQDNDGDTPPTTPVPGPASPNQPPASAPIGPQPLGHAVGDAGTALSMLRLLPQSQPTDTILPGYSEQLPKQALLEGGLGLTSAQANSEAYLAYERSIAQASPGGLAVRGQAPQTPGTVVQTALPDHKEPRSSGFTAPDNPLIDAGMLNNSAHARWSPKLGPCVDPIADAHNSLASLSLLPEIPSLSQLGGALEPLASALPQLAGPLSELGGLLPGSDGAQATEQQDASSSLVSLPNTMSTRSNVRLVDMPNSENKALQSTSTLQMADLNLFQGTPLGFGIEVVSQPTLKVTSTGSAKTSSVEYSAPVVKITRDNHTAFTLDAAHPTKDIPIGIPKDLSALTERVPGSEQLKQLPIVGGLAETANGATKAISEQARKDLVLDLVVIRISIAELDKAKRQMTKPFKGYQLGASARMLNIEILPTDKLKEMLPKEAKEQLPSSLAQVSFGEQIARAYAPEGGVVCGSTSPAPPAEGGGGPAPGVPDELAQTSAAYHTVPIFWTGTGLLLAGVVLVAALPGRRGQNGSGQASAKPSPHPRE